MSAKGTPTWLTVLLTVIALAVVGPIALPLAFGALAVAVSVGATLLKVGGALLALYVVVMLLRGWFGGSRKTRPAPPPRRASLELIEARLDEDERVRRAALDRELALAIKNASSSSA